MPTHAEQRVLPYRVEQMFELVADIERYPEFLPWCVACRITRREGNVIWGDLMVGFKVFRESFTSRVTLDHPDRIDVEYINGPFRYLNNHWLFIPSDDGQWTTIDFYIDFEFRSRMLQKVAGTVFNEAVKRMVGAFEHRADAIYGDGTSQL
jgi:coenzyme Q-binding protein COQ10